MQLIKFSTNTMTIAVQHTYIHIHLYFNNLISTYTFNKIVYPLPSTTPHCPSLFLTIITSTTNEMADREESLNNHQMPDGFLWRKTGIKRCRGEGGDLRSCHSLSIILVFLVVFSQKNFLNGITLLPFYPFHGIRWMWVVFNYSFFFLKLQTKWIFFISFKFLFITMLIY